jgi:hypothetical protein
MTWKRLLTFMLVFALATGMITGTNILASPSSCNWGLSANGHEATVTVTLTDMGLEFGAIEGWQAALYGKAEAGTETTCRFTEWITAENGEVTFVLPDDLTEGDSAPWDIPNDTYVRVRSGPEEYPTFDMVSDPFTLSSGHYMVHIDIDSVNEFMENNNVLMVEHESATVTVHLMDLGGEFGAPGPWEASLYAGAEPGQETSGRFTEWMPVQDGAVVFVLPDDVLEGEEAPWDEEAYVRVRSVGEDAYPTFDLVGRPFILTDGAEVMSHVTISRMAVETDEATVTVTLTDMGLEFGAIVGWEASLYVGAEIGAETSGRFTDWVTVDNDQVTFTLPQDVLENQEAPWNVPDDTYVRVRSGPEEYPTFDLVSVPFTLTSGHHEVHFVIDSMNEFYNNEMLMVEHESGIVMVHLMDMGGEFGAPGLWEASLYAGAEPGQETDGRFTEWMPVQNGDVVFVLPDDVLEGEEAPWGDEVYVRVRSVGEDAYPTFDLVGRPFVLTDSQEVHTTIILQRGLVEPPIEEPLVFYFPLVFQLGEHP